MTIILEDYKDRIDPSKYYNFGIAISSLTANRAYWTRHLSLDKDAKFELARCETLLLMVEKDIIKAAK